jgi:putative ABC transport system substrate-binding protein
VRSKADYSTAFEAIPGEKANGLLAFPEGRTLANVKQIVEFAAKHRLPSMFGWKEYVEGGGLMAYGPNRAESFTRVAVYVDKILKGAAAEEVRLHHQSQSSETDRINHSTQRFG